MKLTAPRDRRLTKGVIIGAAGLALLVGGGTFALWFDNEEIPGGTINSGELDIALTAGAAWYEDTCGTGTVIPVISEHLISPNDVVCFAQPMEVTVNGADISATFSVDTSAIDGDAALLGAVDITSSLTPPDGFTADGANNWTVAPDPAPRVLSANVVFTFDALTTDQVAQLEDIDLSSIAFSLDQTPVD